MTDKVKQILELRASGLSYYRIAKDLKISKSSVMYHCCDIQKRKAYERHKKYRLANPLTRKINSFLHGMKTTKNRRSKRRKTNVEKKIREAIKHKLETFCYRRRKAGETIIRNYAITTQQVLDKIGSEPKCYLTGTPIDLTKSSTYSLDHIVPYSRGGPCTLDNMGLTTQQVNYAKSDMTPDEFYDLCKKVVQYRELSSYSS